MEEKNKINTNTNYRKLFTIQRDIENTVIKKACPQINHRPGIYFFTRTDEDGKYAYIGKSKNVLQRCANHITGHQPIDKSLRKKGFYNEIDNQIGWHLNFINFAESELNEREQYYIDKYQNAGYEMYNIESGGDVGKTLIKEKQEGKKYFDGLIQGRKIAIKELKHIIDRYFIITLKKDGKLGRNALEKFENILSEIEEKEDVKS